MSTPDALIKQLRANHKKLVKVSLILYDMTTTPKEACVAGGELMAITEANDAILTRLEAKDLFELPF